MWVWVYHDHLYISFVYVGECTDFREVCIRFVNPFPNIMNTPSFRLTPYGSQPGLAAMVCCDRSKVTDVRLFLSCRADATCLIRSGVA